MKHIIVPCLAAFASFTFAQETASPVPTRAGRQTELLTKFDDNQNGKLDPDEIEAASRERMRRWDTDGSGKLDQAELKAMRDATGGAEMTKEQRAAALVRALEDARVQKERGKAEKAKGGNAKGKGGAN